MNNRSKGLTLAGALLFLIIGMDVSRCTTQDPKFSLYMVEGERLYLAHCSNCHQRDGKGLRLVYPPLAPSDFMELNLEKVICGMKYGINGEIKVNGNSYRLQMRGIPSLTELEVAELATYIYNSWGHERGMIEVSEMAAILDSCRLASRLY